MRSHRGVVSFSVVISICFTLVETTFAMVEAKQKWMSTTNDQRQLQLPDLPGNCQLFFLLGFDILALDDESMDRFYNDDSFIVLSQTGSYHGKEAMREYISYVTDSSPFLEFDISIANDMKFVNYNDPTAMPKDDPNAGLCEFLLMVGSRTRTAVEFSVVNETFERPTLVKIYFDPLANKVPQIAVYYDVEVFMEFFVRVDTAATASFICDLMLSESCAEAAPAAIDGVTMSKDECIDRMSMLPLTDGDLAYIDGNTRGCLILHGVFAVDNPAHCPHLSFEPQKDVDGKVKCQTSSGYLPTDFFSPTDFDLWDNFKESWGLSKGELFRAVGRDDVLCPLGRKLGKRGKTCRKVCRRRDGLRWDKETNKCTSI